MKDIKIYTAPMAGVSDYTFRESLEEFKPNLIFTEMINTEILNYSLDNIPKILKRRENNVVQLFGANETKMQKAVKYVEKLGYTHINLNCGCPMKKITSKGRGSALIKDPTKIEKILKAILEVKNEETKISLKIRIGYDKPENYLEIAKIADKLNLDHITVHGRTKKQAYNGNANWEYIKEIKENISIPVIGNGDIFDAKDTVDKIRYSNVDGIMLARGILGNPWLINDINNMLKNKEVIEVNDKEKIDFLIKYIKKYEYNNEGIFYKDIRKYINWYLEKISITKEILDKINTFENYDEIVKELKKLIK